MGPQGWPKQTTQLDSLGERFPATTGEVTRVLKRQVGKRSPGRILDVCWVNVSGGNKKLLIKSIKLKRC